MPRILIVAGDAAESLEVMYPYQRLLEEGYDVDVAAPSKKKLQFVVHDFVEGYDTYTEKPGYTMDADLAFADVDPVRLRRARDPRRPRARVHPQRPRLPAHRRGSSSPTTSPSRSCATRRSRSPRPACSRGGAPLPIRRSSRT